jgi:hypothetical protein
MKKTIFNAFLHFLTIGFLTLNRKDQGSHEDSVCRLGRSSLRLVESSCGQGPGLNRNFFR